MEMDETNGRRLLSPTLKPQTSLLTDRLVEMRKSITDSNR